MRPHERIFQYIQEAIDEWLWYVRDDRTIVGLSIEDVYAPTIRITSTVVGYHVEGSYKDTRFCAVPYPCFCATVDIEFMEDEDGETATWVRHELKHQSQWWDAISGVYARTRRETVPSPSDAESADEAHIQYYHLMDE